MENSSLRTGPDELDGQVKEAKAVPPITTLEGTGVTISYLVIVRRAEKLLGSSTSETAVTLTDESSAGVAELLSKIATLIERELEPLR